MEFTDSANKRSDTWEISFEDGDKTVTIDQVIERINKVFEYQSPVAEALKNKVSFSKVERPQLVFHRNGHPEEDTVALLNSTIYRIKRNNRDRLYFQFEKPIHNRYSTIYFGDDRIVYSPGKIFE